MVTATVTVSLTATLATVEPVGTPSRCTYRMLSPTCPTVGGVTRVTKDVASCTSVVRPRGSGAGTNAFSARAAPR